MYTGSYPYCSLRDRGQNMLILESRDHQVQSVLPKLQLFNTLSGSRTMKFTIVNATSPKQDAIMSQVHPIPISIIPTTIMLSANYTFRSFKRSQKVQLVGIIHKKICRSQWPRGLRRTSAAARLLRLWVRVPPEAWMSCLL